MYWINFILFTPAVTTRVHFKLGAKKTPIYFITTKLTDKLANVMWVHKTINKFIILIETEITRLLRYRIGHKVCLDDLFVENFAFSKIWQVETVETSFPLRFNFCMCYSIQLLYFESTSGDIGQSSRRQSNLSTLLRV